MPHCPARRRATLLIVTALLAACGGADRASKKNMLEWAEVLQIHLATTELNQFPERLGDVDPQLRGHLSRTDAWGTELLYRRLQENRYHLISAGPDGEFGDADDIVVSTGHLRDALETYAQRPLRPDEIP